MPFDFCDRQPTKITINMSKNIKYEFTAQVWKYNASNAWHFISLPKDITEEIRKYSKHQEEGWGRMKARAKIGNSEWETSIWFDKKHKTYLLPIKSQIRKKENIQLNEMTDSIIWI